MKYTHTYICDKSTVKSNFQKYFLYCFCQINTHLGELSCKAEKECIRALVSYSST